MADVRTIEGMATMASQSVMAEDLRRPATARLVEQALRDQLRNHAEQSATYLVRRSLKVRWRCEVTGVAFAYPGLIGPDEESIAEQRTMFEGGAERAYAAARFGYGIVSWAYEPDGQGTVAEQ